MNTEQESAMIRLLKIANTDTGQGRRVADFLLSWWNASTFGGFDLTDLWGVDNVIAEDMLTIIQFIHNNHGYYPNNYGFKPQFLEIIKLWRDIEILE